MHHEQGNEKIVLDKTRPSVRRMVLFYPVRFDRFAAAGGRAGCILLATARPGLSADVPGQLVPAHRKVFVPWA